MRRPASETSIEPVREQVEGALAALWHGVIEDDGFNALVLDAHLSWPQVAVLRAYAKYLRQAGTTFSQDYIEHVLRTNPTVTRLLVRLFESRFDPAHQGGEQERSEAIAEEIRGELDEVASLDEDRILRTYWQLIAATLRTNYFAGAFGGPGLLAAESASVTAVPYLVVKLDAAEVPGPARAAAQVRAVRVLAPVRGRAPAVRRRGPRRAALVGPARGLPHRGARPGQGPGSEELGHRAVRGQGRVRLQAAARLRRPGRPTRAEVLACYRMFISAMLDVTDNLEAGRVVPPARVVRHDGDDPYLVVAADKGTATFSDTANEIAISRGFWLGDAFASGGSEGYDHKKMGITARGAWESVIFHFQTLGVNVEHRRFHRGRHRRHVRGRVRQRHAAVGAHQAGGRLRPPACVHRPGPGPGGQLRRAAAPVRPAPLVLGRLRPGADLGRRRRLAALGQVGARLAAGQPPRSGWPTAPRLSPDQLISAILNAPVDLLWNGGIGTYVKASAQSDADVGDRSNDAVRVDAAELRAKVVGEGGNLGLTQEARIEYALARRPGEYRLHRQLRGRGHLRPRGEHQDPA